MIQGFEVSRSQSFEIFWNQYFWGLKIPGNKLSKFQCFDVSGFKGFKVSRFQGADYEVSRIHYF
jgi:hypothetical protein